MELVSHVLPVKSRQRDEVLIMPIGDIQWIGDDRTVALGMLKRHIQWGVDHGAYFIGMGDYLDTFSPSNRKRIEGAALYDTALKSLDKLARDLNRELFDKALASSKGRWLGLMGGHHFHVFREGTTSDMELAQMLDSKFLGDKAFIRLVLQFGTKRGTVLILAQHGAGGGQTVGATINKLEKEIAGWDADIYLMGHTTSKSVTSVDTIVPVFDKSGARLIHRTRILAGTGSFMKGFVAGARLGQIPRGAYPEQAMLRPASLGGVLVKIRPRWTSAGWLPDLSVET